MAAFRKLAEGCHDWESGSNARYILELNGSGEVSLERCK